MPADITCTSCQRKMRVPDTAIGKRIKCPKCQAVIDVPSSAATPAQNGAAVETWHLKTDDGQTYGPIARADLDLWQAEGRLNADSQVLRAGGDQWQWATDLYPHLAPQQATVAQQGVPVGGYAPNSGYAPNPAYAPAAGYAPTAGNAPAAGYAPAAPTAPANPFDFTSGAAQSAAPAAPANPFDFTSGGSSAGRSSHSSSAVKMSDKSKIVAGLLGIFLGAYGVHNFYLGFTGKGTLQLLLFFPTCGLCGFWGVIEGVMILTGSINRDARGRKLRD